MVIDINVDVTNVPSIVVQVDTVDELETSVFKLNPPQKPELVLILPAEITKDEIKQGLRLTTSLSKLNVAFLFQSRFHGLRRLWV